MSHAELLWLSIGPLMKRFRNWRIKRAIQAENRHIASYEAEIKNAHKGIAECKKRLLHLHNSIE